MPSASYIDELLTGLLDGKLSEDERRQLDELLQADSSVAEKLEQLQQIRADLQRIPPRRLKGDFAARVIEQARREAMQAALPAEHHVLRELGTSAAHSTVTVATVTVAQAAATEPAAAGWGVSSRLAASLAALAASILLIAFVANRDSGTKLVPLVDNSANGTAGANGPDVGLDQTELMAGNELGGDADGQQKSSFDDLAAKIAAEMLSGTDTDATAMPETRQSENLSNGLPVRNIPQFTFDLLFVCDIKITQKAWDNNVLGTIFEKAGIQMANPVFASADVMDSLAETRSILQKPEAGEKPQEEVALIFVSASAKAVDKTLNEVWRQANDFPSVALDLAFDRPDQELLKKLHKATDGVEGVPSATPILITSTVSQNLDDVAQFASTRRVVFVSSEERSELVDIGSTSTSPEEDVTSYVLLVIRKPPMQ